MEKNKQFFLLQEWAYYGVENKMESPSNVMLRDYYVTVLVLGIVTFWKCYLYSYVFIKIINNLFFQTFIDNSKQVDELNGWLLFVQFLNNIMSCILEQNE